MMVVASWKPNFFENLRFKNELKVQISWLPKKNIYFKKGFNWHICIHPTQNGETDFKIQLY